MFKQRIRVIGLLPILSILLLTGFITPTKAAQFENEETYTLEQSEIVEENLYIQGEIVDVSGVVDGDLFIGANTVTISGTITGDLYIAANSVDITGNIYGSAYVAGSNVDISGSIARNVVIASMLSDVSGTIGKDLTVFAGSNSISGKVTEDIRVFSNNSTVSGTVKGEALIFSETSILNQKLVEGEVYENIGVEEVREELTDTFNYNVSNWNIGRGFLGINIFSTLLGFASMYIVGVVLIYLAPVKTLKIEEKVVGSMKEFLFSFLVGLGIAVVIPLPLILLAFTLIGTPLALLITGALLFAAFFGTIWVESAIGHKILSNTDKKDPKRLLSLLVGRGLTTVVNFIPIVRGLYKNILKMVAIGAIVRMKYDCYKDSKKKTVKKSKSKK